MHLINWKEYTNKKKS